MAGDWRAAVQASPGPALVSCTPRLIPIFGFRGCPFAPTTLIPPPHILANPPSCSLPSSPGMAMCTLAPTQHTPPARSRSASCRRRPSAAAPAATPQQPAVLLRHPGRSAAGRRRRRRPTGRSSCRGVVSQGHSCRAGGNGGGSSSSSRRRCGCGGSGAAAGSSWATWRCSAGSRAVAAAAVGAAQAAAAGVRRAHGGRGAAQPLCPLPPGLRPPGCRSLSGAAAPLMRADVPCRSCFAARQCLWPSPHPGDLLAPLARPPTGVVRRPCVVGRQGEHMPRVPINKGARGS